MSDWKCKGYALLAAAIQNQHVALWDDYCKEKALRTQLEQENIALRSLLEELQGLASYGQKIQELQGVRYSIGGRGCGGDVLPGLQADGRCQEGDSRGQSFDGQEEGQEAAGKASQEITGP